MKRKDNFMMQSVGGENLLVPLGTQVMDLNGIITLSETAACLWDLLVEDRTIDELITAITNQFDVDAATAHADVQTFVNDLDRMGLLEP